MHNLQYATENVWLLELHMERSLLESYKLILKDITTNIKGSQMLDNRDQILIDIILRPLPCTSEIHIRLLPSFHQEETLQTQSQLQYSKKYNS